MPALLIIIVIVVLVGLFLIAMYNSLVSKRMRCKEAWAQIEVQLKRRHDLIPNLVETVKGYAAHERETLENVIAARNTAADAHGVANQAQAENMLTGALRQLFALSENYPTLKANENFAQLQEELASTENKIAFSRQHYNDSVSEMNVVVQKFPSNIVANMFGFKLEEFFEVEDAAQREAPQVSF
jgi:LemA protein